jgi:hypothetical protein
MAFVTGKNVDFGIGWDSEIPKRPTPNLEDFWVKFQDFYGKNFWIGFRIWESKNPHFLLDTNGRS